MKTPSTPLSLAKKCCELLADTERSYFGGFSSSESSGLVVALVCALEARGRQVSLLERQIIWRQQGGATVYVAELDKFLVGPSGCASWKAAANQVRARLFRKSETPFLSMSKPVCIDTKDLLSDLSKSQRQPISMHQATLAPHIEALLLNFSTPATRATPQMRRI